jgi:hypothetical protein
MPVLREMQHCMQYFMTVTVSSFVLAVYLLQEYKKHKVQNGSWFKPDRHATQYHDVIMYHAGKWIG